MEALIARAVRPLALSQASLPFIYVVSLALSAIVIPMGSAISPIGVAYAQGVFAIVGPDAVSHDENSTAVVAAYTVTGAQLNAAVTWNVGGVDARRLRINSAGELRFTSARNFEKPNDGNRNNIYEIELSASAGSSYVYFDVAVTIRDVNEPPQFKAESARLSIVENAPDNRKVGAALAATDVDDGDDWTFSLSGGDTTLFRIEPTTGQIRVRPGALLDHETDPDYAITAVVTDTGGLSDSIPISISVLDGDDPGVVSFAATHSHVGAPMAASLSDDDGVIGIIRWRWSRAQSPDDSFQQIQGALSDSYTPTQGDGGYVLRAAATYTDSYDSNKTADAVTGAVLFESPPEFNEGMAAIRRIADAAVGGTEVGAPVTATDPQGDSLSYSLSGTDADNFAINVGTGQISVAVGKMLSMTGQATHSVTVSVTDGKNGAGEPDTTADDVILVTINVVKVNQPPAFSAETVNRTVQEKAASGTSVGQPVLATDSDNDVLTYSLSGNDSALFVIDASTARITVGAEPLASAATHSEYSLTVTATDPGNLSDTVNVSIAVTSLPEPLEVAGPAAVDYAENSSRAVATYTAAGPESVAWSVGGTDARRFAISSTGVLTFKTSPDFELPRDANQNNIYEITVSVSDGNLTAEVDVTVTVTNVNEAPTIAGLTTVDYAENSSSAVATYTAANPESDDSITWSVSGTDARRFVISSAGALTFKTSPDFELPRDANQNNIYEITVSASDGNLSAAVDVTVTVTNVNEAPTVTGPAAVDYAENATGAVATYTAANPESDDSITWSVSGTDARRFVINSTGALSFKRSPDFELPRDANQNNVYEITITASDGNLSAEVDVTVTVTNVNEAPTVTGPAAVDFAENSSRAVATYTAAGPESDDSITWSVSGTDARRFTINSTGALSFKRSPDFELPRDANQDNIYEITITASDGNLSAVVDVTVTVTNVNEAPTIAGLTTVDYAENSTSSVATYTAANPESDDSITWSVGGTDARRFVISSAGVLTFKTSPDFELPRDANQNNIYEITVSVSDGNLSAAVDVTVTVTNVNEAPKVTGPAAVDYAENSSSAVATYTAANPESDDSITWSVGGTDARRFVISSAGALTFKASPDFELPRDANQNNIYEITVSARDGNLTAVVDVTVTVTNVNEAPTIAGLTTIGYAENATGAVATYTAANTEDDAPIVWAVGGTDARRFTINSTGVLTFKASPDFELPRDANQNNIYEITITASDGNLSAAVDVTVTVTNVNEAPTIAGLTTVDYAENSTSSVATYTAADSESDDSITWSVSGTDARRFTINSTGVLTFKASPDFELPRDANQNNIYEITITASDGNLSAAVDVTVTVTNVNEAPTIAGLTTVDYAENSTSSVATYTAANPESDAPIVWAVGGTDARRFAISSTGVLTFKTPSDFELPRDANQDNIYEITITASDGNLSAAVDVTVTVTNVNEAPTIAGLTTIGYAENATGAVAAYAAADPESDDSITWSVSGTDARRFAISSTGVLTFKASPDFELPRDANQNNIYEITIAATDGSLSASLDVVVTVTDINEAATITGPASPNYAENGTALVAEYLAAGLEVDDSIVWTMGGTDASHFAISSAGVLTFKASPDFELPRDANQDNIYEITITASDGNLSAAVDVTVTVTNVNEAPRIAGLTTVDYAENSTSSVATYTAANPESDDSITWSVSGTDARRFVINSTGALSFKRSPDFELPRDANQNNIYEITITASDGSLSASLEVSVTVTNINEAATITGPASPNYAENGTALVAEYLAAGLEVDDPIVWTVGGTDASHFAISEEGGLSFKAPPDYESPGDANQNNVYEITIAATDGSLSASLDVVVTVTDINEAATITGPASPNYAENGTALVAEYSAAGLEVDDPIVWTVGGTDASHFAISEEGGLSFKLPPDYESPGDANQNNVYEITIAATDGSLSASLDVVVTVTDINEAATITGPASPNYAENGTALVAEYLAAGLEVDDPIVWTVGGTDASHFAISEEGVLTFKASPDFELPRDANQNNIYEITITASVGSLSASLDVVVTVTNINEAPTIAGLTTVGYAENATGAVATYTAVDPESGDPVSWTVGGADALRLAVNEQGVLSFKTPPNFELPSDANQDNTYEIEINVSDGYLSVAHHVSVAVVNANDAPSFPLEQLAVFIPENSCPGAHAILRGIPGNEGARIDEDGDPLIFALSGADAAAFVIHPPTGYVTLGPGVALNHESAKGAYVLRVSVSDGRDADGNAEATPVPDDFLELVASVMGVDEPPVFVESTLQRDRCGRPDGYLPVQLRREVTRGSPVSAPAGQPIVAIDPEGGAVAYKMETGIVPAPFVIDPVSGRIRVSGDFDFSSRRRVYTVRVTASDGAQETAIETRISIISAPAPTPTPTPRPTPTPEPSKPEPIAEKTEKLPSRSGGGDTQAKTDPVDSNTISAEPTRFPPWIARQEFVQVAGAIPVQSLARAAARSDMGNVSLSAPPGALSTPYQVRLRESGNLCADAGQPLGATMRLCVAVELFDAVGDQLAPVRFNRPVSLEFVVHPTAVAATGIGRTMTQDAAGGSLDIMSRPETMKEWRQLDFGASDAGDGARILATSILEPGRFMVVSQPPRPVGLVQTPEPRVADSAQRMAIVDENKTPATQQPDIMPSLFVRPAPIRPSPTMISISPPQRGSAAGIPALLVAIFLDVTLVLMTASVLYRITRPRS